MEKSRNLELVGASPTEWQLITPRGGLARPPPSPHLIGLKGGGFRAQPVRLADLEHNQSHVYGLDL